MVERICVVTAARWTGYLRWIVMNTLAELVGLGSTALLTYVLMSRLELSPLLTALWMVASGILLEGILVGILQASVLSQVFRSFSSRGWITVTALGAGVAWSLGIIPSLLFGSDNATNAPVISPALTYILAAVMGFVLGIFLGGAQWLELRRYAKRAYLWIFANCFAWAFGMTLVFITIDIATAGLALPTIVITLVLGLSLTGAIVGAIHGAWLFGYLVPKIKGGLS